MVRSLGVHLGEVAGQRKDILTFDTDAAPDSDEYLRMKTLREYGLLDPVLEDAFTRITALVADIFGVRAAYISLVNETHQWFQNPHQLIDGLAPRAGSFCDHIVTSNQPLIVPNAIEHPVFSKYLHVREAPHVRFYAGVPLVAENGQVLGALCLLSDQPRYDFGEKEIHRLEEFSSIIMAEANLRRTARERDDARRFLERAVDFSEMAVWQLDPENDRVMLLGAVDNLWGPGKINELKTNKDVLSLIYPDDVEIVQRSLERSYQEASPLNIEFRIQHPTRGLRWLAAKGDWEFRGDQRLLAGVNADITEQRSHQEHANLLMRELHHRMRNLFATVGAIISLTRQSAENIEDYYERITYRLDALNRAQNVLLGANFMTGSMHALMREMQAGFPRIRWSGPDLVLPENALVSMTLLLNELATNAVKHGAFMSDNGEVKIDWWHEDGPDGAREFHMRWMESGVSHAVGPPERTRFGTSLMERSVRNNLGGRIERRWDRNGLICDIIMPARWRESGGLSS